MLRFSDGVCAETLRVAGSCIFRGSPFSSIQESPAEYLMPAYQIRQSIEILAPVSQVFAAVADFATWDKWSPWLCIDREATVTVSSPANEVGSLYQWASQILGKGSMEHRDLVNDKFIECNLTSLKPFKSKSNVRFDFEDLGDRTNVTWTMNGELPFFLFWMKARMVAYVGMDYERGLLMLKDWIETGEIRSKIEFIGLENRDPIRFMGASGHCRMDAIEDAMNKTFEQVLFAFENSGVEPCGEKISIYLPSSDMQNGQVDYVSGITTPEPVDGLDETILPPGDYMHVRHIGSYKHLGNAWYSVYQNVMHQKRKVAKSASFEIYANDPKETSSEELITDIYLPVR